MTADAAYNPLTFAPPEEPCRTTTSAQLQQRESFPADLWDKASVPPRLARQVLQLLAEAYDWPNHHMVPDDCLACLLDEPTRPMAFERFLVSIGEDLRVSLEPGLVLSLRNESGRLVDLLREIQKQWPVRLDAQGRIDGDVTCSQCGYNLRTVLPADICPDCGTPVSHTLDSDLLRQGDPAWLATLRKGLAYAEAGLQFLLAGLAAALVWAFLPALALGGSGKQTLFWTGAMLAGGASMLGLLLLTAGTWWMATPQPNPPSPRYEAAKLLRYPLLLALLLLIVPFAARGGPGTVISLLGFLVLFVLNLVGLARLAAGSAYRIPNKNLARTAESLSVSLALAGGLMLLACLLIATRPIPILIGLSLLIGVPALVWLLAAMNKLRSVIHCCRQHLG